MKFFIDTANLAQIREANEMGVLDGVTTNPSLMAKENIRGEEACRRHYLEICSIVDGDVSAEVIATDFDGMVREGEALAALHKNIVVKLPCTADGIRAVKYFAGKNIRTNCTLVFSVGQALLAAKGRVLVNLDKADRYFDLVVPVLERTGTTRQIVMKGSKPADEVLALYGKYLDEVIYMPVVNLDNENAAELMQGYIADLKPAAYELLYAQAEDTACRCGCATHCADGR